MLPASAQRLPEAFFIKIGASAKEWKAIHYVIRAAVGAASVGQTAGPTAFSYEPAAAYRPEI
jgi:hypothetical protein